MRPKILLVDDDKDLLEAYREILSLLPSQPEIFTSSTGARGLAMLEAEPFTLLITDLNMPKMDGLQLLSIVRRKYPELRTVVLTSVMDEQFRSRVYSLGVDLFWHKPASSEETKQFLDCLESLLGREVQHGFRGVQSKSLVDIIQLECLSHNSAVLKIINGPLTGHIWIHSGEVIDAATDELTGESAFQRILSWKAGNFESLPAEAGHPQTIFNSYQALLLQSAQAHDEAEGKKDTDVFVADNEPNSPLAVMSRFANVEFVLVAKTGAEPLSEARGLANAQPVADWTRETLTQITALGERLQAGPLQHLEGRGPQSNASLASHDGAHFCIGWEHQLTSGEVQESTRKILTLWAS